MKKIISAILVMVCLLSCLTVCANATYDTIGNARNATIGTTYSGTLSKNNEHDYYKFTVSSSGRVDFTFTAYAKSTVYVDLYDSNKEHIDYFGIYPSDQLGYCFEKHTGYFTKGVFYLCIDSLGSSVRYGNYSISTSFTSANETFPETLSDNDNFVGSANAISANSKINGQLGYSDDVDFYSINIPSNAQITFSAVAYAESTVYVTIYDKNINEVEYFGIYPDDARGYCYCNEKLNLSSGKYYIAIESLGSDIRVGFYNFSVKLSYYVPKVSNIRCAARNTSAQKIAWNSVSGATGYRVQRSNNGGTSWSDYYYTNSNSFVFNYLTAGGKYKFRARAYKTISGKDYYGAWSSTLCSCCTPAKPKLKSVSSPKHTQIKTTWAKASGTKSGYQILYGRNSSFSSIAARKNVSASKSSYTGKNFTKGRTYYVKVRTYTTFNGKAYYSAWSAATKVKCK